MQSKEKKWLYVIEKKIVKRGYMFFLPTIIWYLAGITHFISSASFYTPWKDKKTSGFLMFSGGIERTSGIEWITPYPILDEELRKKYDLYGEEGLKDDHFSNKYQSWSYYNEQFGIYDDDPEIITLSQSDFRKLDLVFVVNH